MRAYCKCRAKYRLANLQNTLEIVRITPYSTCSRKTETELPNVP